MKTKSLNASLLQSPQKKVKTSILLKPSPISVLMEKAPTKSKWKMFILPSTQLLKRIKSLVLSLYTTSTCAVIHLILDQSAFKKEKSEINKLELYGRELIYSLFYNCRLTALRL